MLFGNRVKHTSTESQKLHFSGVESCVFRHRRVIELPGPRAIYDRLSVPVDVIDTPQAVLDNMPDTGLVTLVVGKGRLGLEWLRSIQPLGKPIDPRS